MSIEGVILESKLYPNSKPRKTYAVRRKTAPRKRVSMKKRGSGRIKPKGISKLKKQLDAVYSKYIRTKYAINGICRCYTCGKSMEIKKAQCGHFVPRIYLATRWDESNTRVQCPGCNLFGRGQLLDFEDNLTKELGIEAVRELKMKRLLIWKLNAHWYEAEILRYTELLSTLS